MLDYFKLLSKILISKYKIKIKSNIQINNNYVLIIIPYIIIII